MKPNPKELDYAAENVVVQTELLEQNFADFLAEILVLAKPIGRLADGSADPAAKDNLAEITGSLARLSEIVIETKSNLKGLGGDIEKFGTVVRDLIIDITNEDWKGDDQ